MTTIVVSHSKLSSVRLCRKGNLPCFNILRSRTKLIAYGTILKDSLWADEPKKVCWSTCKEIQPCVRAWEPASPMKRKTNPLCSSLQEDIDSRIFLHVQAEFHWCCDRNHQSDGILWRSPHDVCKWAFEKNFTPFYLALQVHGAASKSTMNCIIGCKINVSRHTIPSTIFKHWLVTKCKDCHFCTS